MIEKSIKWRVAATSIQGSSHQKRNQPCQDANNYECLSKEILIGAVADGAGSALSSEIGSQIATQKAVAEITSKISSQALPDNENDWQNFWHDIFQSARDNIAIEAENRQIKIRELATTLILVIATPELVSVAQIGDGAVVICDRKNQIIGLTSPNVQESLDLTTFLTSPNAWSEAQFKLWEGQPKQIAMFSDGIQMLALTMPEGVPYEPFFLPLFNFIEQSTDENDAQKQLTAFLQSERVQQRADDDLTLLLATFDSYSA